MRNIFSASRHHRNREFLAPCHPPRYRTFPCLARRPPVRRSFIRKAVVSTMFRAVQERDPGVPGYSGGFGDDEEEESGLGEGAMVHSAEGRSGARPEGDAFVTESKIESAAAACVLWSTVGVGCLVRGRPKSSVSKTRDCCSVGGGVPGAWSGTYLQDLQSFAFAQVRGRLYSS